MMHVTIDDSQVKPGCNVCCCEVVSLRPGETQPLKLNYAPWALPIAPRGLHCEPSVVVEAKDTCATPVAGNNLPPQAPPQIRFDVAVSTPLNGDLKTQVTDPEGATMTFTHLPHYGPTQGTLKLKSDGTFTYTPIQNQKGEDRFWFNVSDGVNAVVMEAMLGVGIPSTDVKGTWDLTVGKPVVDQRYYMVTLPITASPAAKECQVFRLTIRQGALDCNCDCYYNISCVDVRIAKC